MDFTFFDSSKENMSRPVIDHFFVIPQLLHNIATQICVEVIDEDSKPWFRLDSGVEHSADLGSVVLALSHN